MVDTEETGWPLHEERPATWERRVPEKMMGFVEQFGLAGRAPDLVLIGSLFWDERFIREVSLPKQRGADGSSKSKDRANDNVVRPTGSSTARLHGIARG